jgi:hypothetical protein
MNNRTVVTIIFTCGLFLCAFAQDLITKKSGEDIKAKILEIGQSEIKYKKFDNLSGPIYTISISDILIVRYENGTNEVFEQAKKTDDESYSTPIGIKPNLPYKYYEGKYNSRLYTPQYDDPYNPTTAGVCSFLIPGLGQIISGETGRGLAYLGGYIGCMIAYGSGMSMLYYDDEGIAIFLTIVGAAGALTVSISSIVDAVRVAKIKNMYVRDVRKMSAIDLKLSPYVESVSIGGHQVTPVGLSLRASF